MDFSYQKIFSLSDYERVLLDWHAGRPDAVRSCDGVEETWSLLSPVIEKLESKTYQKNFRITTPDQRGPMPPQNY